MPIISANRTPLKVLGTYALPITLRSEVVTSWPVTFVSDLSTSLLLGIDLLKKVGANIDCSNNRVTFQKKKSKSAKIFALSTLADATIPPHCLRQVRLGSQGPRGHPAPPQGLGWISSDRDLLFEGVNQIDEKGHIIGYVQNLGSSPLSLDKGSPIGTLTLLDAYSSLGPLPVDTMTAVPKLNTSSCSPSKKKWIIQKLQIGSQLSPAQRQSYLDLALEYHDVFSGPDRDMGFSDLISNTVHLKEAKPIHNKQFPIPWAHRKFVEEAVDDLLRQGCIERSCSPFNTALFCVKKKGTDRLRIVLDFRPLNEASFEDKYLIEDITECIDSIGRQGSTIFSSLDLINGFWQQNLDEKSRPYTAFTVPGKGRFHWKVSPMGLHSSPAAFQKLMEAVLEEDPAAKAYLDDVLIHSKDAPRHLQDLRRILERLRRHVLKLNTEKTIIGSEELTYLGFILSGAGIRPGRDKLKSVASFKPPETAKEILSFLGLCNFFRRLVPHFSHIAGHLSALTRKDSEWKGGPLPERALKAFRTLQHMLVSQPIVAHPKPAIPFELFTDASAGDSNNPGGIGAVLMQEHPEGKRVIAYASRQLKTHEKNYSATMLERLASAWAVRYFHTYLAGKRFILYTDHKPNVALQTKQAQKTLDSLQQLLNEYDFRLVYHPGPENVVADYLSRHAPSVSALAPLDQQEIVQAQAQDETCQQIRNYLADGSLPDNAGQAHLIRQLARNMHILGNLLVRRSANGSSTSERPLIPEGRLRGQFLRLAHEHPLSGHQGRDRTAARLAEHAFWPGADSEVSDFVKSCQVCQRVRDPPAYHQNRIPMQPLPACDKPHQRLHIDLYGPFLHGSDGHRYILSIVDAFSKWLSLIPVKNKEARTIFTAIHSEIICRFGAPKIIVSDRGLEFTNQIVSELCDSFGIRRILTAAAHPEANAQVEQVHRVVRQYMQSFLSNATENWVSKLPPLCLAYNTSINSTTQTSPYFLTFRRHPDQAQFPDSSSMESTDAQTEGIFARAKRLILASGLANKRRKDRVTREPDFAVGSRVLVRQERSTVTQGNPKFARLWVPMTVLERVRDFTYRLIPDGPNQRATIVHASRIKSLLPPTADNSEAPSPPPAPPLGRPRTRPRRSTPPPRSASSGGSIRGPSAAPSRPGPSTPSSSQPGPSTSPPALPSPVLPSSPPPTGAAHLRREGSQPSSPSPPLLDTSTQLRAFESPDAQTRVEITDDEVPSTSAPTASQVTTKRFDVPQASQNLSRQPSKEAGRAFAGSPLHEILSPIARPDAENFENRSFKSPDIEINPTPTFAPRFNSTQEEEVNANAGSRQTTKRRVTSPPQLSPDRKKRPTISPRDATSLASPLPRIPEEEEGEGARPLPDTDARLKEADSQYRSSQDQGTQILSDVSASTILKRRGRPSKKESLLKSAVSRVIQNVMSPTIDPQNEARVLSQIRRDLRAQNRSRRRNDNAECTSEDPPVVSRRAQVQQGVNTPLTPSPRPPKRNKYEGSSHSQAFSNSPSANQEPPDEEEPRSPTSPTSPALTEQSLQWDPYDISDEAFLPEDSEPISDTPDPYSQ